MDNLRAIIVNLFCNVSSEEILNEEIQYDSIKEHIFVQLGSGYNTMYSNDELRNMYYYFKNEFLWNNCRQKSDPPRTKNDNSRWCVFDALVTFDMAVLIEENGQPMCRYVQLLRWREMITYFDEDLFITSFLAYNDYLTSRVRHDFFWRPVIGHNNRSLNCLVEKGVAENHFHLKGSAPLFHLSWICIMNCIDNDKTVELFESYDANRLQKKLDYNAKYKPLKLVYMWRQAALIRLFFAYALNSGTQNIDNVIRFASKVNRLLHNNEELMMEAREIQQWKDIISDNYSKSDVDYMICEHWLVKNDGVDLNGPLSGERYLLYKMFEAVYKEDEKLKPYFNWFYLYLVIKTNIRRELVQSNTNVGFDNFQLYQDRKDLFIENNELYDSLYTRMAVRDTIYNQHITCLEARIAPKDKASLIKKSIEKNDNCITRGLSDDEAERLKARYFYVIHFIKKSECFKDEDEDLELCCRQTRKREEVKRQALAIAELRNSNCAEAMRIRGIDACSPEIWCRPEVFAQAFRFLKNHTVDNALEPRNKRICPILRATYHVGEDFLDIIDGLRAIDEAISFLNLNCGDRLGHALALGIDVQQWYEGKNNRIVINKMGYLDNLAWLYAKIRKYKIDVPDATISFIEKRYEEYFTEIYRNNIDDKGLEYIRGQAIEYYDVHNIVNSYKNGTLVFGINEYYDAWKLRGDNPYLYKNGFFDMHDEDIDEWDSYGVNKYFPQNYQIRYTPQITLLYYMYHFVPRIKVVGDQRVEIKVDQSIIDVVKMVQKCMQFDICRQGIGIEANPSSNYFIGTFKRYDRHPIISWYNYGLVTNQEDIDNCPQLQVSINTDDQGVFSTYIENEYAYMAIALEKMNYNRTFVLQWLDNIRRIGIDQSFNAVETGQ